MGLAEWSAAMVRAAPPACSDSSAAEKTTLGGEPALAWTATCSDGYDVDKLAILHRTRGYMVLLASPTRLPRGAGTATDNGDAREPGNLRQRREERRPGSKSFWVNATAGRQWSAKETTRRVIKARIWPRTQHKIACRSWSHLHRCLPIMYD
jgi:hypothetical protein